MNETKVVGLYAQGVSVAQWKVDLVFGQKQRLGWLVVISQPG